jgi:hypothetical protein
MPTTTKITLLKKKREKILENTLKYLRTSIDEYERSIAPQISLLSIYEVQLQNGWERYKLIQSELDDLDDEGLAQETEALKSYSSLNARLKALADKNRLSTHPTPSKHDPETISEVIAIKLPEIHLPMFDGTIEEWNSFYNPFVSTIDRNEKLTPVQKFHYLRSSMTGKAARSIQSLDITETNYSIAINVLREKFDRHCMHASLASDT